MLSSPHAYMVTNAPAIRLPRRNDSHSIVGISEMAEPPSYGGERRSNFHDASAEFMTLHHTAWLAQTVANMDQPNTFKLSVTRVWSSGV
jgi:hypothetical protein